MKQLTFAIPFGIHKDKPITEIPDSYLFWLAKPRYSGKFYTSLHSTDKKWKVPINVQIEARKEADRRGFELQGETWRRK